MTEKQIETALNGSRNLFITGPAGTGKSYLLNKYIEEHDNVLVCAPTGIAALNIGGDTMHKVFHIPVPAFESPSFAKGKKGAITKGQLDVIAKADTIIIDEISMCRNDVFSYAVKVIRKAEKVKGSKIKVIVCGDFSQLPPVVQKKEIPIMKKFGLDISGFAFTTQEWKSMNFKVIELTDVKRQNDIEFINELNKLRIGDYSNLEYFNQFVNENPDYDEAICICGTNAEAERINNEYLESLPGNTSVLQSRKEGRCGTGFINDFILIKEGARVIFTSNDLIGGKYKNGTFGTIKYINSENVTVTIDGKDETIWRQDYPVYSFSVSGNVLNKKEIGVIHQYPFKLGKAITIHKSQGQTFDKVIISPEIFAAGQLYVVLSRVKSTDGLFLLREVLPEHLIIDSNVEKFYKNNYTWDVKKKTTAKKTTVKTTKRTTAAKKGATASKSKAKSTKSTTKTKTVSKSKKTSTSKASVKNSTKNTSVKRATKSTSRSTKKK